MTRTKQKWWVRPTSNAIIMPITIIMAETSEAAVSVISPRTNSSPVRFVSHSMATVFIKNESSFERWAPIQWLFKSNENKLSLFCGLWLLNIADHWHFFLLYSASIFCPHSLLLFFLSLVRPYKSRSIWKWFVCHARVSRRRQLSIQLSVVCVHSAYVLCQRRSRRRRPQRRRMPCDVPNTDAFFSLRSIEQDRRVAIT